MQHTILTVGGKDYKLRATAQSIVNLEKALGGRNPLDILLGLESTGALPSVTAVLHILHAGMQKYHSNISFNKVLDLYDQYVDEGNNYTDLLPVLIEVFQVSGFFKQAPTVTEEQENE